MPNLRQAIRQKAGLGDAHCHPRRWSHIDANQANQESESAQMKASQKPPMRMQVVLQIEIDRDAYDRAYGAVVPYKAADIRSHVAEHMLEAVQDRARLMQPWLLSVEQKGGAL
jgi:hypothetical protein